MKPDTIGEVEKLRARVQAWQKAEQQWNRKIFAAEAKIRGLEDKLAAIAELLRWRPIAEWPEDGWPANGQHEVATGHNYRAIVPGNLHRDTLRFAANGPYIHFRPVLPGPEGA